MITGTPKFDGIAVGELSCNLMHGPGNIDLKVKIAFVNQKSGATHGSSTHTGPWSQETITKLKEFVEAIEADVAKHHLDNTQSVSFGGSSEKLPPAREVGGIGEHFGDRDPPQV